MAFKAIMKVQPTGGVPTKAERFAKLERSLKQEGATKGVKLVKPSLKKEGGLNLQLVQKRKLPSHVATGRLRHYLVYSGRRQRTSGGLKKEDIGRNKRGRYVSLKQSANGHKFYKKTIKGWNIAFRSARTQLSCHGFVAINGRTLMGQALYCRMKKLHVKEGGESLRSLKKEEHKETQLKEGGEPLEGGVSLKKEGVSVKKEEVTDKGQSATADPTSAATTSQTAAAPAAEPAAAPAA